MPQSQIAICEWFPWYYTLLPPLGVIVSFLLTLVVVARGRGAMAGVALLLLVALPVLIGVFLGLDSLSLNLRVISTSPTQPRPSAIAKMALDAIGHVRLGMLLMVPSLVVAIAGSLVRSFSRNPDRLQATMK